MVPFTSHWIYQDNLLSNYCFMHFVRRKRYAEGLSLEHRIPGRKIEKSVSFCGVGSCFRAFVYYFMHRQDRKKTRGWGRGCLCIATGGNGLATSCVNGRSVGHAVMVTRDGRLTPFAQL